MSDLEKLEAELREAERALDASWRATHTHGHQNMTWKMLAHDSARVAGLRVAIEEEQDRTRRTE